MDVFLFKVSQGSKGKGFKITVWDIHVRQKEGLPGLIFGEPWDLFL